MYYISSKRSESHASANQDPTNYNHRSAAIAIDQYTADRACTQERNILHFWQRSEGQILLDKSGHGIHCLGMCQYLKYDGH